MKHIIGFLIVVLFRLSMVGVALAAPTNPEKGSNNPNVVAYYPTGIHAIPTDPVTYVTGTDLVTMRGNTGEIQAWYTGEDGHGVHSVWNVSKDGKCSSNWVLIPQAYPNWGDYLTPGADYCVLNNSF